MNRKKSFIIISIIIAGFLIMEVIKRKYFPNNPDVGKIVLDSIYKLPRSRDQLGELRSFRVNIDSMNNDNVLFRIGIQGTKGDTTLIGELSKIKNNWKIKKLSKDDEEK